MGLFSLRSASPSRAARRAAAPAAAPVATPSSAAVGDRPAELTEQAAGAASSTRAPAPIDVVDDADGSLAAPSGAVPPPPPAASPSSQWLHSIRVLDILAEAVDELCVGRDPITNPSPLRRHEDVKAAIMQRAEQLATSIGEAAAKAAWALPASAAHWLPDERIADVRVRELFQTALKEQQTSSAKVAFPGATRIYAADGLAPTAWGISKAQLVAFIERVRAAHAAGRLENVSPPGVADYSQARFDDPAIGPSIHQVTAQVVLPHTDTLEPISGLGYALGENLSTGGLRCDLFFSHAWDAGIFEFAARALDAWPDGCDAAYICFLSNPQNLGVPNVRGLNWHPDGMPFERVLSTDPKPKAVLLLTNSHTPIQTRLWAVCEAHAATVHGIATVRIEGPPSHVLPGEKGDALRKLEEVADEHAQAVVALAEKRGFMGRSSKERAERERAAHERAAASHEAYAHGRLEMALLATPELFRLVDAGCSFEQDARMIRDKIRGREAEIEELVADLMRQSAAGVAFAPGDAVDGPLGALPLHAEVINGQQVGKHDASKTGWAALLQLARWMRSKPAATTLDLFDAQLLAPQAARLLARELNGKRMALQNLNLYGNHLGAEGAKVLAKAVESNTTLTNLHLARTGLEADAARSLGEMLELNGVLTNLNLRDNALGDEACNWLAESLAVNVGLTCIDLSHNPLGDEAMRAIGTSLLNPPSTQHLLRARRSLTRRAGASSGCRLGAIQCDAFTLPAGALSADLSSKGIGPGAAVLLAGVLKCNTQLMTLQLASNDLAGETPYIRASDVQGMSKEVGALVTYEGRDGLTVSEAADAEGELKLLDLHGVRALADTLKHNTTLLFLNLWNNDLGAEGAKALAKGLEANSSLSFLDISGNSIGDAGMRAIGRALMRSESSHLGALKCDAFAVPAEAAAVDLSSKASGKPIGPSAVALLAGVLKCNSSIRSLNLSHNAVCGIRYGEGAYDASGAVALAEALATNTVLRELDLYDNHLGSEGGTALATLLAANSTLTSLSLAGVGGFSNAGGVGPEGGEAIAEALKVNVALEVLDLSLNQLDGEAAKALADALYTNTTLRKLEVQLNQLGSGALALDEAVRRKPGFHLNL